MLKYIGRRNPISYSIWLMPGDNTKDQLSEMIKAISHRYGGGPVFDPHVTLVSSFLGNEDDLLKSAEALSKKIKPFNVVFDKINYLDEFFRSIFLKVKFTDKLREARNIACNEFDCIETDYLPHMSLAYGKYKIATKEKIANEIGEIPVGFLSNKIYLAHNNEIDLRWEVIKGFKLHG